MDPLKDAAGAIVLLFMLLGALDLFVMGAIMIASGIVSGPAGAIVAGGILLALGAGLLVAFRRGLRRGDDQ